MRFSTLLFELTLFTAVKERHDGFLVAWLLS